MFFSLEIYGCGIQNTSKYYFNTAPTIEEPEYILANIDALGYYRVNYDINTWGKLTGKLKMTTFTVSSE